MNNRFHSSGFFPVILFSLLILPGLVSAQWEEVDPPRGGKVWGIETDGDAVLAMMPSGIYRWKPGSPWKKCHEQSLENYSYFKYTKGIFYLHYPDVLDPRPVFYSLDQGDTWEEIKNFRFTLGSAQANGQKVFAFNKQQDSLFVTTDFGTQWTYVPEATPGAGRIMDYAVLGDTMFVVLPDQIARSFDGGQNWESLPPPQSFPVAGFPACRLVVTEGLWYLKYYQNGNLLYRSRDHGQTWDSLGPAQPYDRIQRVGNRIYAYFPAYSDDQGLTWTSIKSPGYYTDFMEYQGKLLLSSTQGLYEDAGDFLWHSLNAGFPVPLNTADNDESFIASAGSNLLVSSGFYSPDAGSNWYFPQTISDFSSFPAVKGDTVVSTSQINGISYTTDGAAHWAALPLGDIVSPFSLFFAGDTLFVLAAGNKLWYTLDLGQNWSPFSLNGIEYVYKVVYDGQFLYAMDHILKKVYQSTLQSPAWTELDKGFPTGTFAFYLYANHHGVFISANDHLYRYDHEQGEWVVSDSGFFGNSWPVTDMSASGHLVAAIRTTNHRGLELSPDGGRNWFDALHAGIDRYPSALAANFHQGWLYTATVSPTDNNVRRLLRRPVAGITTLPVTGFINGMIQPGVPNVVVRLRSGNGVATPAPNAAYELHGAATPDTVELAPIPGYSEVEPAFWEVIPGGTDYDFYLGMPDPVCHLSLTHLTPFKADAETVIAVDPGCTPDTGQTVSVKVFLPSNIHFAGALPPPSAVSGGTLDWTGLQQNNSGFPEISLTVRTDAQAAIGDPVLIHSSFKKGNTTYADTIAAVVVSSFDPNDKQCQPTRLSLQEGQSGAPLDYTIRFQNTGTAPAATVRIRDTLRSEIDLGSIQFLAASHPNSMSILPGRILEFLFAGIMLPDSNTNEPASHGFVRFTARSVPGLPAGGSIANRAAIYFDLNAPVITNTCLTTVDNVSGTGQGGSLATRAQLHFTPNPSPGAVRLTMPGHSLEGATIFAADALGRTARIWSNPNGYYFDIPANDLAPGTWFISVRQNDKVVTGIMQVYN